MHITGALYTDSSAALAVIGSKGNGKLRHVRVGRLWIQEIAEREEILYRKVSGKENPADAMTKNLAGERVRELTESLGQLRREGRAAEGLATGLAHLRSADGGGCGKGRPTEGECETTRSRFAAKSLTSFRYVYM